VRYPVFLPVGSTIEPVEAKDDHPAAWRFALKNREFAINRSPLMNVVGEYFTSNKSGFFTANDLWKAILPKFQAGQDVKAHLDGLGVILSRMVQEGIITVVLHPPTDRVSDPRRPYARTFVRQMLKRDATVVPNTMFEPVKINPHEAKLMKQFDGRRTITEYVTDIQNEIRKGRLQVGHNGVPIQADQRDDITQMVEDIVQKLRSLRLVI
jgi:methyltransferase-like protein